MTTTAPAPTKYDFPSAQAKEFPMIVVLENTTVCNLRCIHCPQGQGYPEHPDYHATYMPWDIYKKAIDELAEQKITVLRFSPSGEALIHAQFLDQLRYAKEKGVQPINLTTNGLTLDNPAIENGAKVPGKMMMDRILEIGLDVMDISLDAATREKYEQIRVGSSYHRVWSNVHRLLYKREKLKAPTKLMLSIIDQPESHDDVEWFVKYWTPLVDRVLVRPYLENLGLTPHKPGTVVESVKGIKRWPCPQFWKRVSISPDGSIRFCVVDWLDRTVVGNVRTHTMKELWHSAEYDRLRTAHLEGRYGDAHHLCGPCTDWVGMRWDWGFEIAINAVMGDKSQPSAPPPPLVPGVDAGPNA